MDGTQATSALTIDKNAVRTAVLERGMTHMGAYQLIAGEAVSLKSDRAVIVALLSMYLTHPASAQAGKAKPGRFNFERYFDK